MSARDYLSERYLLLDLYMEGTITFIQYVDELGKLEFKRQLTLAGIA